MSVQMARRAMLFILVSFVGAGCSKVFDALFIASKEVNRGALNGLTVEMNRKEAAMVARRLGSHFITPVPCSSQTISKSNLSELPLLLSSAEGISINSSKSFLVVYLSAGRVVKKFISPAGDVLPSVVVGDELGVVWEKIDQLMKLRNDVSVYAIVNTEFVDTMSLDQSEGLEDVRLNAHACWRFELTSAKPAGATYDLIFKNGALTKIDYRRGRIRME